MPDQRYAEVLDAVRRVLKVDDLDVRQDFFDMGASSLTVMHIVGLIEREQGVEVSITDAFDAPDLDSFITLVVERLATASAAASDPVA